MAPPSESPPLAQEFTVTFISQSLSTSNPQGALTPRIGVMVVILFVSLFAVSFPSISKQAPALRIPRIVFFIGKHFGTGVILSTAFCHLLPDAFGSLQDPAVQKRFNMERWAGLIILGSLLTIFVIEYVSTSYVDHLQFSSSTPSSRAHSPSPHSHPHSHLNPRPHSHSYPEIPTTLHVHTCAKTQSPPLSPLIDAQSPPSSNENTPLLTGTGTPRRVRSKSFSYGSPHPVHVHGEALIFEGHHRYETRDAHCEHHSRGPKKPMTVVTMYGAALEEVQPGQVVGVQIQERRGREDQGGEAGANASVEVGAVQGDAGENGHGRVGKESNVVGILVLQMGIMIHSLVIGLTLAITHGSEFTTLVTAITFHQLFEGLSLGIRIASLTPTSEYQTKKVPPFLNLKAVLAVLFALTTPAGMIIGLLAFTGSSSGDRDKMRLTSGIMSAISAGMLIYAACVEMLAGDFVMDPMLWRSGVRKQVLALASLFAGVGAMVAVD